MAKKDDWTTVLPPDGTWCWVYTGRFDDGEERIFLAKRSQSASNGWSNDDCWEDFDGEVQMWIPLTMPDPPDPNHK